MKKLKEAKDLDVFETILSQIHEIRSNFETMNSLVNIRYKINTNDRFYGGERKFIDKISPIILNFNRDFYEIIVNSKFKEDFNKKYGKNITEKMELSVKTISPEVTDLLEKENQLASEYFKITGSATLSFQGKKMNLSQIRFFFESKNRNVRKEANEVYWRFFSENQSKFDELYDKLVKTRHEIAVKLGYETFIDLAYDRWGRKDFDKNDVKKLRENLIDNFLPLTKKIRKWQKEKIKVEKLKYYDESVFLGEEFKPIGDSDSKIKSAQKMFLEMGKETKKFFSYMVENNLLDLDSKKGKAGGGFCDFISNEKSPFIFMNFNNTPTDIITLVHESGHAFAHYQNRDKPFLEWSFMGLEIAEIHSMSMEFFSWSWQSSFFEDEKKFKLIHLAKSILFIPYGLLVDEFQHWVYANPQAPPQERRLMWRELEQKYLPNIDYGGNSFLEKGGFWFKQLHLFELPFYYIDYVIAQLCAYQYLIKSKQDFRKSWKEYINLINSAFDKGLIDSLKVGNLQNPFEEKTIKSITSEINSIFDDASKNS